MKTNKLLIAFAITSILLTNVGTLQAQDPGLPCGGEDPDATCPLDSWVLILVAITILFAIFRSFYQKKNHSHGLIQR